MFNSQPSLWTRPLGQNADVNNVADEVAEDSGNVSMKALFPIMTQTPLEAGGIAPERKDFNALFKMLGEHSFFLQRGGVYGYSNTIDYDIGSFVRKDGAIYVCITANGPSSTVVAPSAEDNSYWLNLSTQKLPMSGGNITGSLTVNNNNVATESYVNTSMASLLPAGSLIPFAGASIPSGFLLCNGSAVSRTTYADLFTAIGTLYGAGDGSTTFNLPDARDRFLEGAGTNAVGSYLEAGLPNITGSLRGYTCKENILTYADASSGALYHASSDEFGYTGAGDNTWSGRRFYFDASRSSSTYGNSSTVQPKSLNLNILIKY